jgi:hypothetical protein
MQLSSIVKMHASQPGAEVLQPAALQRPKQIEPSTAVWIWDGSWWPAVVTRVLVNCGERLLIVRFEHGLTAPARPGSLESRDPDLGGADKPCAAVASQSASAISERHISR